MKRKELAIPSRLKVFNSIQNDTYLQLNVYLSLGKSAVSFEQKYDHNALVSLTSS